jgi:hypothetical protein
MEKMEIVMNDQKVSLTSIFILIWWLFALSNSLKKLNLKLWDALHHLECQLGVFKSGRSLAIAARLIFQKRSPYFWIWNFFFRIPKYIHWWIFFTFPKMFTLMEILCSLLWSVWYFFWNPRKWLFPKKIHHAIIWRSLAIAARLIFQKSSPYFWLGNIFFMIPKYIHTDGFLKILGSIIAGISDFFWNPRKWLFPKKIHHAIIWRSLAIAARVIFQKSSPYFWLGNIFHDSKIYSLMDF